MWQKCVFLAACLVLSGQVWAQKSDHSFKYESAQRLILNSHLNLDWYGDIFYYRWETGDDTAIYRGDAARSRQPEVVFTVNELKKAMRRAGCPDPDDWKLYGFDIDEKKTSIHFRYQGKRLVYDWKRKRIRKQADQERTGRPRGNPGLPGFSPSKFNNDSSAYIYARSHQLYIQKLGSDPVRLSDDGRQDFSFDIGGNREIDTLREGRTHAVWAGSYIVAVREDRSEVAEMSVINSLAQPRPVLRTYKFPIPGDTVIVRPVMEIWDAGTKQKQLISVLTEKDQRIILPGQLVNGRTYLHAPRLGTDEDGLYFLRRNRSNDRVELCRLEFATGEVRTLIDERTVPHINEQLFAVHVLPGEDILFWSERSGYGQFYRYNKNGELQNRVGPAGDYVVGRIHYLDTAARSVILEVHGFQKDNNPYYKQYLKSDLDSGFGRLLTDGRGYQHEMTLSDNKRYLLNRFSSADSPPAYVVSDTAGRQLMHLGQADISGLQRLGWIPPEKVDVMAADGETKLYGLVYRPATLDPERKYPVIASVYPGPQDDFVPRGFTIDDDYHQSLADLGYVVVQVPSRGSSPLRGLRFHGFSHGNMRDYPLADNKLAIQMLARDRSYMDLGYVGIYGHSGGGFMSATAILTYPDFYKVAVAASGNYDPNIYTQWWGETYHGINPDGAPGYIPTTMELAGNLKGKLLLITGDVDINVHPAQTFRLAEALINESKYFDMMVLPGKDHGLGDRYYQNLIRRYFLLHLNNTHDKPTKK